MQGLIWGILRLDGAKAETRELERLSRAVGAESSIGPASVFVEGSVALARAALVPTGAEGAAAVADGGPFLCDGRFYPRRGGETVAGEAALGAALGAGDEAGIAALHGDFAAALWQPEAGRLRLCRDIFGVRPLFYVHRPGAHFAFCSLAAPLIAAGLAAPAPDAATVMSLAAWNFAETGATPVAEIKRVPAAHLAEITARGVKLRPYWCPAAPASLPARTEPKALAEKARTLLAEAVRRRLPASGPAAAECSGGLDSSAIAALAADALADGDRSVLGCHYGTPERPEIEPVDATPYVSALAQRQRNLEIRTFPLNDTAATSLAPLRADRPAPVDAAMTAQGRGFAEIGRRGIGQVLVGYGGDETLSSKGQGAVFEALARGDLGALVHAVGETAQIEGRARWHVLAREIAKAVLPRGAKRRVRALAGAPVEGFDRLDAFLTPRGRRLVSRRAAGATARGHRMALLFDGRIARIGEGLSTEAARHGVTVAFPFLDRDLVEFSLRLPATAFLREGTRRWLLRAAMADVLPEMIRNQPAKVPMQNARIVSLAENRAALLAELDRLAATEAAELFDIAAIRRAFEALPSPEAARDEANRLAREGAAPDMNAGLMLLAFTLARFYADGLAASGHRPAG